MQVKKILLFEADYEENELFTSWLQEEAYKVTSIRTLQEINLINPRELFDIFLMDIGGADITKAFLANFIRIVKKNIQFEDLPIILLAYKREGKKIAGAIEAGANSFLFKPFETDYLLRRMDEIFKEIEIKKKGKKIIDLNYITFLIDLTSEGSRKDFYLLAAVIFNIFILNKVKTIIGEGVIVIMMNRINQLIGNRYAFIKEIKFSDGRIHLDGFYNSMREIPIKSLAEGFKEFVYVFLRILRKLTSNILINDYNNSLNT